MTVCEELAALFEKAKDDTKHDQGETLWARGFKEGFKWGKEAGREEMYEAVIKLLDK